MVLGVVAGLLCAGGAYAYVRWKRSHGAKLAGNESATTTNESHTSLEISPVKAVVKETPDMAIPDI
jgi:hypothetical protein